MKKSRMPPELVEAEWRTIVAAEEALNASYLRTLFIRSNEGRVVACGREESVARVITEMAAVQRAMDEAERSMVDAAERLRLTSAAEAYLLSMGDGFVLACGEAPEVARLLDRDGDRDGDLMPALRVLEPGQPPRLAM